MRILIVSDTHGKNGNLEKVLRLTAPLDLMFHLGDLEGRVLRPAKPTWSVAIMIFLRPCRQKKSWPWDITEYLCPMDIGTVSASIHCVLKKLPESMGVIWHSSDIPIVR